MKLGTPLVVSDKHTAALARIPIGSAGRESYQECFLQELIDQQPGVLPIADFCPRVTGVFTLGREVPVDLGGAQGFIDNLLITDTGQLIIVETKLWRNPEAIRQVVVQTLQYGMAVSQMPATEMENCLRKASPKGRRLGLNETVAQFVQSQASSDSAIDLDDDFEEVFDRLRRAGEIVLLIATDCVRSSAERIVNWMNTTIGSAPHKLGLVELCLYELPDVGRIVVPKTLLRIREGSRHVVTINIENGDRGQVTTRVTGPDIAPTKTITAPPQALMTEEKLLASICSKNSPEHVQTAQQLLNGLKSLGLDSRTTAALVQYGIELDGDFLGLVDLNGTEVYCYLRKRAIRALGDDKFVECKRKICSVAEFYRTFEVDDPTKLKYCAQHYDDLNDKVEVFLSVVNEVAVVMRAAITAQAVGER